MMRYPWDDLADAYEDRRTAERAGDVIGVCDAEDAVVAAERQLALLGLLLFRRAAESEETAPHLLRTLDRLPPTAPVLDAVNTVTGGLRRQQEWLVCEVKRLQAENWELARWVRRLEVEIDELKAGPDVVTQEQGDRRGEGPGRGRDEISPMAVVEEG